MPPGDRLSNRDSRTHGEACRKDDVSRKQGLGASQPTHASQRGGSSLGRNRSGCHSLPRCQCLHWHPGGIDRETWIITSKCHKSPCLSQRGDIPTMGLYRLRGHSENRRESPPRRTGHSRHTAPRTAAGSGSGSGFWGTRCNGTSPHTCPTIRIGSPHSGARETRNIPLVGLL